MEMNNLFSELKKQHESLQKLLDLIFLQQTAIINNDVKLLEEILQKESAFFNEIEMSQRLLADIIIQLAVKHSIKLKSNNLSDFIESLKSKNEFKLGRLIKLHESMKDLVYQIIRVNNQNKLLINQAKNFVKELIAIFMRSNKSAILDRKI